VLAFILQWVLVVIALHQLIGMQVFDWFPRVVTVWVPLPFDQILELMVSTVISMIDDGLDLELRIFIHQIRRGTGVIGSMHESFCYWHLG